MLDNLHIRLFLTANVHFPDGRWSEQNVQSSYWRFYWNEDAGAALRLPPAQPHDKEEIYPLEPRRAYFVPAGVRFGCSSANGFRHFYVHFDVVGLHSLAMREIFNAPICVDDPTLPEAVEYVRSRTPCPGLNKDTLMPALPTEPLPLPLACRIKGLLFDVLALYLESLSAERLERCAYALSACGSLQPVIDYIRDHLADAMTNADLADLCHISETYFIAMFRDRIGIPPGRYISRERITAASQLLLFTEQTIDAVALRTGFSNRYYFTRVFTQATGISPAAFRKARRV